MQDLPGVHPAPNIQHNPDVYELENLATDPSGFIEKTMQQLASWQDKTVLDLGAGTGFYVKLFQKEARHVIAIEPDGKLRVRAMERVVTQNWENVSVLRGSAEQTLLADQSVDIVHARFAYFFAPDCEPGVHELKRIIRPGGTAFIIDNDLTGGTFAEWVKYSEWYRPDLDRETQEFWAAHDFQLKRIASELCFENRADLEAVVKIEFAPAVAERILANHVGNAIAYHYALYYRQY